MKCLGKVCTALLVTAIVSAMITVTPASAQQKNIILATTTSTQDSGLLDVLIPMSRRRPATS